MKKFKTTLIVLFAVIIVILVIFLVKNINNDKNKDNDKVVSEIKYIDNKLMILLNGMNNITLENFKVSVRKTSVNSVKKSGPEESLSSSSSGKESESSSQSKSSNSSSNTTAEQYGLKEERILTNNNEINWEEIKNEVELLYATVPTMTLDLYSYNISQQEILGFNKELDELTVAIKEENKEQTLIKLANLYRYLPAFVSGFSEDSEYVNLLETKSNVFNSYVFVNLDNWNEATNYINKAIDSYLPVLNNLKENNNQYDNQKIYVILNELKSTTNLKDRNVFLIKYRNLLEETQKGKI